MAGAGWEFYGQLPDRGDVWFVLTKEDMDAAPEWSLNADNPPLSVRDAMRIGHQEFLKKIEYEIEWVLSSVELLRYGPYDQPPRWFYHLHYEQLRDRKGEPLVIMGRPFRIPIIVLMNGRVLPEIAVPPSRSWP